MLDLHIKKGWLLNLSKQKKSKSKGYLYSNDFMAYVFQDDLEHDEWKV